MLLVTLICKYEWTSSIF